MLIYSKFHSLGVSLVLALASLCAFSTARADDDAAYAPVTVMHSSSPVFETDKSWKFEDNHLIFFQPNSNANGKRYLIWKDYRWIVGSGEITAIDPDSGARVTASRQQVDSDGKLLKDKEIMKDLKDRVKDRANDGSYRTKTVFDAPDYDSYSEPPVGSRHTYERTYYENDGYSDTTSTDYDSYSEPTVEYQRTYYGTYGTPAHDYEYSSSPYYYSEPNDYDEVYYGPDVELDFDLRGHRHHSFRHDDSSGHRHSSGESRSGEQRHSESHSHPTGGGRTHDR